MSAYWHVRLCIQKGWAEGRGAWQSQRAADQRFTAGNKACGVAKELVGTADSVRACQRRYYFVTDSQQAVSLLVLCRSTQSVAVWRPESNGAEVTIERGNLLQRMGR